MADCRVISLAPKACSGKCRDAQCSNKPNVWVLAACTGVAALYQKQQDGCLKPLFGAGGNILSFGDGLNDCLTKALERAEFSQLVLVGSANDISWTQASLSAEVSKQVAAEIVYPLMPAWFDISSDKTQLTLALQNVFRI